MALIEEGADLFATDRRNRTALDWSRIARRDGAARVLERATENEIRYRRYCVYAGFCSMLRTLAGLRGSMRNLPSTLSSFVLRIIFGTTFLSVQYGGVKR